MPTFRPPRCGSPLAKRKLVLNSRTAPALYLRVRRITLRDDGRLEFDGTGEVVDAVVEMKRFDQRCLFDQLAAAGGLTADLTTDLARMIASFHRTAPVVHAGGGAANIASVLDINEAGMAAATHVFARRKIARFNAAFRERCTGIRGCSIAARRKARCAAVTATCTCATSACSTVSRGCSTASSSTTASQPSTRSMISPSC